MITRNLFITIFCLLFFLLFQFNNSNKCFSWYILNSGTDRNLNDVIFINMNTGWVGGDSILLKTTNGGVNWIIQQLPVQIKIRSLYFTNENEGYILGDWSSSIPAESKIYFLKTTNSGYSWNILNLQIVQEIGTVAYSEVFRIITDNIILKTYSEFKSSGTFGGIMKSTNGGLNFYNVLNFGDMTGISFIDLNTGWVMGTANSGSPITGVFKVFKTTNQGENWFTVFTDSQPSSGGIQGKAIKFFNQTTGYILASLGNTLFLKTTNGGVNWSTNQYTHYNNRTMFFCDLNTGWIAGSTSSGNSNIRKTIDGGILWVQQNQTGSGIINKLFFLNNNIGWVVGYNGIILKTTNGGTSSVEPIGSEIPDRFLLKQNFPNPFNSYTKFEIHIPEPTKVKIVVYDILGKEIETLVNELITAGIYKMTFNPRNLSSGVYFYKLFSNKFTDTKSMILIK